MEAWDSQYHVVETASGRLTNLYVVLLKCFAAPMRLVRLNILFFFLYFFLLPLFGICATRDNSSVEMFPRRHREHSCSSKLFCLAWVGSC